MGRFLFILLLASLALKQVSSLLSLLPAVSTAALYTSPDETENEKESQPDHKSPHEDKLHLTSWDVYSASTTLKTILHAVCESNYTSYRDQPHTPPPNFI